MSGGTKAMGTGANDLARVLGRLTDMMHRI